VPCSSRIGHKHLGRRISLVVSRNNPQSLEPPQRCRGSVVRTAVAAAAGLVGFTIGTETTGSLIGPSIVCGAVGLRPTYGRVSLYGCMQLCWSLDKIGPIAATLTTADWFWPRFMAPIRATRLCRPAVRLAFIAGASTIRVGYVPHATKMRKAKSFEYCASWA